MSFSSEAKAEMCRAQSVRKCCAVAECYGVLLYCNTFTNREIKIITESRHFSARLKKLFSIAFDMEFDMLPDPGAQRGKLIHVIHDRCKISEILETYGYSWDKSLALHVNLGVIEDDCCREALIRGAFLAGGSVTDPEKRYHLELVTTHLSVGRETFALLLELDLMPKETRRSANYIIYFKQSEFIEDFLTRFGAPASALRIMEAKIEKELRNEVNRRVNCDTANLTKVVEAAQEQIEAIRRIENGPGLAALPLKLRDAAVARRENPESTLAEVAELMQPPLTKSCLNHRLRKIMEISKDL